ncbi:hypothetical protein RRG08_037881 [Elysia crispata]|uniref:Uncharacterized protein n=1 Tax=Elysia crispata TaxID=231223 RepID=A0AAE0ZJQ9_9GAST|nr:hypothetical protein RRG08_037881 [Elysia crispata]
MRTTNQIKCLLDGCDDWDVSADLPEWDSHPSIIKETRLRPDIVIHSASTQQLIMVELTVPYENRMEEAHIYKREKYMNLTKELENAGYKAVNMPVEVENNGHSLDPCAYVLATILDLSILSPSFLDNNDAVSLVFTEGAMLESRLDMSENNVTSIKAKAKALKAFDVCVYLATWMHTCLPFKSKRLTFETLLIV